MVEAVGEAQAGTAMEEEEAVAAGVVVDRVAGTKTGAAEEAGLAMAALATSHQV